MASTTDRLYSRPEGVERLAETLEKPLLDKRTYRVIRLPNQLEALLCHDAETDKASAAMDVNVGSMSDPEDMQGIAHAVEHALFLGTEKFPQENEYNSYLNKYGGESNAFTAPTSTNYYFECSAMSTSNSRGSSANASQASLPISQTSSTKEVSPLWGALDRFSQFFVKPLFLENVLDRELRAVDSENKKNLQSDNWRLMQLGKSLSSPEHPWHLFSTGNYKLLHDDPIARGVKIRDEFIKFYEKHYSANRMKLCVVGREDLDTLQEWVEELFSPVVNKNLPELRFDATPALTEKELGLQIFVKPIMDQKMLDILFPYPDQEDQYDSNPSRYISHLIGHEGPGSILAYLKEKGWANELSAGAQTLGPGLAMFAVGIRLTASGLKHYQEIIKILFQYIAMIKETPPQEWIVWESGKLAEIEFKFRQPMPASRTTSHLSGLMQKPIRRDWLLSGQTLVRKFNPEGIRQGLEYLRPDNFRFTLVSKEYPGNWDQKEQWYGTEYRSERIPSDFMKEITAAASTTAGQRPAELHMPHKNVFIPTRLDVQQKDVEEPAVAPKLIRNDPNVRLWWKKDDQFWVPKAHFFLELRSPILGASAVNTVMQQVYKDLVEDALSTYGYDAELAGLEFGVAQSGGSLTVEVGGYNDKLSVLLEKVIRTMRDLEIRDDRFEIIKERKTRAFENQELLDPYRQVTLFTRWMSKERYCLSRELAEVLPDITAEQMRAFYPQVLRQMHMEMLVTGNVYKEEALKMADLVESVFKPTPYPPKQWVPQRYLAFPSGSDYLFEDVLANPDNVNHCIEYVVHVGDAQDRAIRARLLLISQMMDEPAFNVLRTKEQLGYVVGSGPILWGNRLMHRILIQSERDCPYLEQRIDAFLFEFEKMIQDMPLKRFEEQKIGVINKRLEKIKTLGQESGRFWHHISSQQYDFELGKSRFYNLIITPTSILTYSFQSTATSNTLNHSPKTTSSNSSLSTSSPAPPSAPSKPSTSSPRPPPKTSPPNSTRNPSASALPQISPTSSPSSASTQTSTPSPLRSRKSISPLPPPRIRSLPSWATTSRLLRASLPSRSMASCSRRRPSCRRFCRSWESRRRLRRTRKRRLRRRMVMSRSSSSSKRRRNRSRLRISRLSGTVWRCILLLGRLRI